MWNFVNWWEYVRQKCIFTSSTLFHGEKNLIDNYFGHNDIELSYIKTDPYSYGPNVFILGDAAHAIVPFYGQGLNSGMEDIMIFDGIFKEMGGDIPSTGEISIF